MLLHRLYQPNTTGAKPRTYIQMRVLRFLFILQRNPSSWSGRLCFFCFRLALFFVSSLPSSYRTTGNNSEGSHAWRRNLLTYKRMVNKLSVCSCLLLCCSYKLNRASYVRFLFRDHFSNAISVPSHSSFPLLPRVLPIFFLHTYN